MQAGYGQALTAPAGMGLRTPRCDVQRSVQRRTSRQYQRMSEQAALPSAMSCGDGSCVPHIQHALICDGSDGAQLERSSAMVMTQLTSAS
jgi:hypothetical protein